MFPHLLPFTHRHPRLVALIGFAVFITVANFWFLQPKSNNPPTDDGAVSQEPVLVENTTSVTTDPVTQIQSETITVAEDEKIGQYLIGLDDNRTLYFVDESVCMGTCMEQWEPHVVIRTEDGAKIESLPNEDGEYPVLYMEFIEWKGKKLYKFISDETVGDFGGAEVTGAHVALP